MPSSYSRDHFPVHIHSDLPILCQKYFSCVSFLQASSIHTIIKIECVESLKGHSQHGDHEAWGHGVVHKF